MLQKGLLRLPGTIIITMTELVNGATTPEPDPEAETEAGTRLVLPSDIPEQWAHVCEVLGGAPLATLADLDTIITSFSAADTTPRVSTFFTTIPGSTVGPIEGQLRLTVRAFGAHWSPGSNKNSVRRPPGAQEAGAFDFRLFFEQGAPLMVSLALEMPTLFEGVTLPIFKTRSTWGEPGAMGKRSVSLSRRQCACLLAHSVFGSLRR